MFHDLSSRVIREIEEILEDYDFEQILEDNDVTPAEAIFYLYHGGYIVLPETNPITIDPDFSDEGDDE